MRENGEGEGQREARAVVLCTRAPLDRRRGRPLELLPEIDARRAQESSAYALMISRTNRWRTTSASLK